MNTKTRYAHALADYVLDHGIGVASLRPMAKAAGTSDRMLVYHFGSRAGVLAAALDVIVDRNTQALDAALPPEPLPAPALMEIIERTMASGALAPSLAVFFELAALALRGDDNAQATGQRIASHFQDWLAARLLEPERAGELLGAIEGWGLLGAVGLDLPFPKG